MKKRKLSKDGGVQCLGYSSTCLAQNGHEKQDTSLLLCIHYERTTTTNQSRRQQFSLGIIGQWPVGDKSPPVGCRHGAAGEAKPRDVNLGKNPGYGIFFRPLLSIPPPPLPLPFASPFLPLPLEVGPLNTVRGSGGVL